MQACCAILVFELELSQSMLFDLALSLWISKEPITIVQKLQMLSAHGMYLSELRGYHIFLSAHGNY